MIGVHFRSHELKISSFAYLSGPIVVVHHDGEGWQAVQRQRRLSYLEWEGAQGLELQIPLLFHGGRYIYGRHKDHKKHRNNHDHHGQQYSHVGHPDLQSVETEILNMEIFEIKLPHKARTTYLSIDADGRMPHDKTVEPNSRWVIIGVDWSGGYQLDKKTESHRVRAECTVTVWRVVSDQIDIKLELTDKENIPKTYKVKPGDTLMKIAAYFYGDQARWHDIAQLNHLHDPSHLKVGSTLKMPKAISSSSSKGDKSGKGN